MEFLTELLSPLHIKNKLPGISDKVLQERLRKLVRFDLVNRRVLPSRPPCVIYSLSQKGKRVLPILQKLESFIICKPKKRNPSSVPEHDS